MIALHDGRKVGLEEYGDPAGTPALWFHGAFSSRLEASFLDAAGRDLGVRIVSLDRPGAGGSDPLPGRTITGYAADVAEVLDALAIDTAAVGGLSNGGMYAMAVASALPDRVLRAVPVNPSAPIADPAAWASLSLKARLSYRYINRRAGSIVSQLHDPKPAGRVAKLLSRSNPDAHLYADPAVAAAWAANTAEIVRQRDSGYLARELALVAAPWGFDHRAVRVPVALVSGEKDAGLDHARVWVSELPQARLVVVPGGHGGMVAPAVSRRVVELLTGEGL